MGGGGGADGKDYPNGPSFRVKQTVVSPFQQYPLGGFWHNLLKRSIFKVKSIFLPMIPAGCLYSYYYWYFKTTRKEWEIKQRP